MSIKIEALKRYAKSIRETLRGGPTNIEQALAPSFKNLIDELLPTLVVGQGLTTVPEYANDVGRPDIALVRQGQLPQAFVELKAPEKNLEPTRWRDAHDKRQFGRFCELPVWALSNFGGRASFAGTKASWKSELSRKSRLILLLPIAWPMPPSTGTIPGHLSRPKSVSSL